MSIDNTILIESHPEERVRDYKRVHSRDTLFWKFDGKYPKRTILCEFCNDSINDVIRRLFLPPVCYEYFCKDAEHLHGLWKQWKRFKSNSINDDCFIKHQSRKIEEKIKTSEYDDHDHGYVKNDDKNDVKYFTKNPIHFDKKSLTFNVKKSNFEDAGIKTNGTKEIVKKMEDSRGRSNRMKGQERSGKMIHDRTNEKIPLAGLTREGGWKEIEKGDDQKGEMTVRGETEDTYRRFGEKKGNKMIYVVGTKNGDVLNRESGSTYHRDYDEETKFLPNREKRVKVLERRNEVNDRTSSILRRENYNRMDREKSTFDSTLGNKIEDRNDRKHIESKDFKLIESSLTIDEDISRTKESRRRNIRSIASLSCKNEIGSPNTIEYQLSDDHFVKLGWTVLPVRKFMRKIFLYESKMAKPHLNWFKKYRYENRRYYEDGVTPFLIFHPDTTAEVFYPNGRIAVKIRKPKNREYDTYTVFASGDNDIVGIGRKRQRIIAIFDSLGNGIILDENNATRLSYNQIGGIWKDNPGGLPFLWTWSSNLEEPIIENVYSEKSTKDLEKLLSDWNKNLESTETTKTPLAWNFVKKTDITSPDREPVVVATTVVEKREEYLESEFNDKKRVSSPIKENHKPMKLICLKLNEYMSFRILDRSNVSLQFFSGARNIRIELGTMLDYNKQLTSYYEDTIDWRKIAQRCKFQDCWKKNVED